MSAHVVVVGGGYAGWMAVVRLAKHVRVTWVSAGESFVERVRLHEVAAGYAPVHRPFSELAEAAGAIFRQGWVTGFPEGAVALSGGEKISCDAVILAAGAEPRTVAGVDEHAFVMTEASMESLAARLQRPATHPVAVVGGGDTGLEMVTELAVAHRERSFVLVSRGGVVASVEGKKQIEARLEELGIRRVSGHVSSVEEGHLVVDSEQLVTDAVVWCSGFRGAAWLRETGLPLDADGLVVTDGSLRVPGTHVVAAGDCVSGMQKGCVSAMPMGCHAAAVVLHQLGVHEMGSTVFRFGKFIRCLSLGTGAALVETTSSDGAPISAMGGLAARATKASILRWTTAVPMLEAKTGLPLYSWYAPEERMEVLGG